MQQLNKILKERVTIWQCFAFNQINRVKVLISFIVIFENNVSLFIKNIWLTLFGWSDQLWKYGVHWYIVFLKILFSFFYDVL